jgi:septum formation protein
MRQLILGSSSPARRALLTRLQLPFEVAIPDADETPLANEAPADMVKRLAVLKANIIAKKFPQALIIGADQVGTLDEHVFSKPLTHENAVAQLRLVSGRTVRFYTAICLLDASRQQSQLAVETYDVMFRKLSDDMIEHYLKKEDVLHCAGSFHAEGLGITLIERFVGDDYTALIGLPLIRLTQMLKKAAT